MAEEEESYEDRRQRANRTGTCWLNDIFTLREVDQPIRLGPLGRTNFIELIWVVLTFIVSLAVFYGLHVGLTAIHAPFAFTYSLISTFSFPFLIAFQGRKLAHYSPLRKTTGEGMGAYIRLRIAALNDRFSWIGGKPTMYNLYETRAGSVDFKVREMPAIEWIGSQRAPMAPHALEAVKLPSAENDYDPPLAKTATHIFYPRGHRTGSTFAGAFSDGVFGVSKIDSEFSYRNSDARSSLMDDRVSALLPAEPEGPVLDFESGTLSGIGSEGQSGNTRKAPRKTKRLRRKSTKATRRPRVGSNEQRA